MITYFKDKLGQTTEKGDTVALASRVGNSAEIKIRVVTDFGNDSYGRPQVKVKNPDTGRGGWSLPNNMINISSLMKED